MSSASAVMTSSATAAPSQPAVFGQQVPLAFLKPGDNGVVVKVRGKGDTLRHLENLGFVPGARVRVANDHAGSLIVEVKGAQVALDRSIVSRIIVSL